MLKLRFDFTRLCAGVRKDSPAAEWQAAWQAEMGDVKAGSAFASKQSDAQKEGFGSDGKN